MNTTKYVSWSVAKTKVHDASGVNNPEKYNWFLFKGVYYPTRCENK